MKTRLTALASLLFTALLTITCDHRQPLGADISVGLPILDLQTSHKAIAADVLADTFITITATVADANHGALQGQRVDFRATTGFVVRSATTDDRGIATVLYHLTTSINAEQLDTVTARYGYNDGQDTIIATVVIRILPPLANTSGNTVGSIQLLTSLPYVQIKGAGGEEQAWISARVSDIYNNPIKDGTPVTFAISAGPGGGESLNQTVGATISGVATVTLNSGTRLGVIEIQATCLGQSVRSALLTVTSGPPHNIDIRPISNADSIRMDGSRWKMYLHAVLTDVFNNPVRNSIGVVFMLNPRTSDSTMTSIVTSSRTGAEICAGCTPVYGSAATYLTYRSELIYDTVEVTAQTVTGDRTITVTKPVVLPLPKTGLTLRAEYSGGPIRVPNSWTYDTAVVRAILADGFGYPVPRTLISISSDAGRVLPGCVVRDGAGVITGSGMCGDSVAPGDTLDGVAMTDRTGTAQFMIMFSRVDKVETKDFREVIIAFTEKQTGLSTAKELLKLTIQFTQ